MRPESAIAYHDRLAFGWDERYATGSFRRRARFFEARVLPSLPKGGLWLDAGCGTGTFSRMLASGERRVLGVDASHRMLAAAELARAWSGRDDGIRFEHVACIASLPFEDRQFDGVLCLSVLEYLEDPHAALAELVRVLRPGGQVVYSVPRLGSPLRALQRMRGRVATPGGLGGARYMRLSRHATTEPAIRRHARDACLTEPAIHAFDPYLPERLHPLLPPSLLFAVAAKRDREP